MAYKVSNVEVYAGDILNKPGTLARVLEGLKNSGANLEFVIARRAAEHSSRVFVAPIKGKKQKQAASEVGLVPAAGMHALRVEGPDRAGLGADITRAIADQGINLRGVSAAAIGKKSVTYFAFESPDNLASAIKIVKKAVKGKPKKKSK